jgi:hypothetical protein
MRRLLQSAKPKRRRATKVEMAERRAAQQQQQNPADGPQAQSPAVVSPQTAAQPSGASPAPPPEAATPTWHWPRERSYGLPMVTLHDGQPALSQWARGRLLEALRKAQTTEEIAGIQKDNREHIAAYKATLTPMGGVAFQKEIDDIAKEIRS